MTIARLSADGALELRDRLPVFVGCAPGRVYETKTAEPWADDRWATKTPEGLLILRAANGGGTYQASGETADGRAIVWQGTYGTITSRYEPFNPAIHDRPFFTVNELCVQLEDAQAASDSATGAAVLATLCKRIGASR